MKVLLFTHKIDIDGMGSAVLANLAFDEVEIVYTETFEINDEFNKFIDKNLLKIYDKIYVTDICLKEPVLGFVENDEVLKQKVQVFDHHITEIKEGNDKYGFVNVCVENKKGKCSGTSLFYDYLKSLNLITNNSAIDEFVELTRQYDTWEWKNVYGNEKANELNILFNVFGREKYVKVMTEKLKQEKLFGYSAMEQNLIDEYKKDIQNHCDEYLQCMTLKNINGASVGVCDNIENKYRNDLADHLKEKGLDVDYVVMFVRERGTVSFRSINSDVDVSAVAETFNGKGHRSASSCPISESVEGFYGVKKGDDYAKSSERI